MKLYRNKYIIGMYENDKDDTLITICDNAKEFSDFMEISIDCARMILCNAFNKKISFIRYKQTTCYLVFIEA